MAGSLALNVEILGQFNKLTAATNGATGQLQGLSGKVSSISSGIGKALGAIGVGFSLGFLKRELTEAAKAAIDEAKTMEILSIAMQNTGKATEVQVGQAEDAIKAMSLQSAVADDKLRPAYQKLFIATGDVTQSNRYLQIALDAYAATGKDLDSVTQAMAKSLAGQDTALVRLIPSLAGVADPLEQLGVTFAGAAEAAANLDPYQRMSVAMGEIQETIGAVLMPMLNELADWMVDIVPKIQAFFDELANPNTEIGAAFSELDRVFQYTAEQFGNMITAINGGEITWADTIRSITYLTIAIGTLLFMIGRMAETYYALTRLDFGKALELQVSYIGDLERYVNGQMLALRVPETQSMRAIEGGSGMSFQGPGTSSIMPVQTNQNVTINVNNGNVTAQEIANTINRQNRASGTNLIRGR
jgi:hypothetical protein